MNAWSILAIVLSIGVIALVGFMIPILIQIKDLLKMAENTVIRLEKDVEPVLQNVEGITHNFEGITGAANDFVNRKPKEKVIGADHNLIDNVKSSVTTVKTSVTDTIKSVKQDYIPEAKFTANKYLRATKKGISTAIQTFKTNKPVSPDKQIIVYEGNTDLVKVSNETINSELNERLIVK